MLNLIGEFDCTMDAKGRVRLPSGLIKQLGERETYSFVLTRGLDKELILYPQETWVKTTETFANLNLYDNEAREFVRRIHRGATPIEMDDQGRILIPKRLIEFAGLEKDLILNAMLDKIGITIRMRGLLGMKQNQCAT
jgi:MraZ protein